jgi:L-threonylcarbamoyladenylate synthase
MLAAGKVVAFPTETVYGLGADAANPEAVSKIFQIKGRPADHPLIVHLAALEQLSDWAQEIPDDAYRLAEQFWPGPLTLILRRDGRVSDAVTGGQNTVGLRVPGHPVALELLKRFGSGIAAPSANRFGRISPTTARHVFEELGDQLELIIDAGPSRIGLESTIVSLAGREPVLLRPGAISAEELETSLGNRRLAKLTGATRLRTPGMLPSHYAPLTSFRTIEQALLRETLQRLQSAGKKVVVMTFSARVALVPDKIALQIMPDNPVEYARELYAVMRVLDNGDFDCILADTPPDTEPWQAVRDRLYRAAG